MGLKFTFEAAREADDENEDFKWVCSTCGAAYKEDNPIYWVPGMNRARGHCYKCKRQRYFRQGK